MQLASPLFTADSLYSVEELNDMVRAYAQNDSRLKDIVDSLMLIYSTSPFPPGSIMSPAQLKALLDTYYDYNSLAARNTALPPLATDRYLQELKNVFALTPMKDLLDGVKIGPKQALAFLKIFSLLKGLLFWVEDGPSYDLPPVYVQQGLLFFTTILKDDSTTDYLLVDADGVPSGTYAPLPAGAHITLIDFWLNRMMVHKLNVLYRIGAFEAGLPTKWTHAGTSPDFVAQAFAPDVKRYPCGFVKPGQFRFLREDVSSYARNTSLANLIPGSSPEAGVDFRLIMDESFVQTPFGLFRVPKSIIHWADLVTEPMLTPDPDEGDRVLVVCLEFTAIAIANAANGYGPVAVGSNWTNVQPLEKAVALSFTNDPTLSGSQKQHLDKLGGAGHQHGLLIGTVDVDTGLARTVSQYFQITCKVVVKSFTAKDFADGLALAAGSNVDEVSLLNAQVSSDTDTRWRLYGVSPRALNGMLAASGQFTGYTLDDEQNLLSKQATVALTSKTLSAVLPLGVHLLKRPGVFDFDHLNACPNSIRDAWAIRSISSVQAVQQAILLNDAFGNPEQFPENFVNSQITIYRADGSTVQTTIIARIGDKLAQLPKGVAATLAVGDIVVFDQRVAENTLNKTYLDEVSSKSWIDVRTNVLRAVDYDLQYDPGVSPFGTGFMMSQSRSLEMIAQNVLPLQQTMRRATESKLRYNLAQRFFLKASDRYSVTDLRTDEIGLKGFLLEWVKNYEANKEHPYVGGENIAIHWPEKNPITKLPLSRYVGTRVFDQEDHLAIQAVQDYGDVPTLVKFWKSDDHQDYPILVNSFLSFISDKPLTIPGHTRIAGSFYLQPKDTLVVEPLLKITLTQMKLVQGVKTPVELGSIIIDWTKASSFRATTGLLRVDGESNYNTLSQRIVVNFNQVVNFSVEEPGSISVAYTYHDLENQHHLFTVTPADYGVQVSHLVDTEFFKIAGGEAKPLGIVPRLEGISINGGTAVVRWNREDTNTLVTAGGFIKSTWVLRGIPWITISNVVYDQYGMPIDLDYTASWIKQDPSVSSIIEGNSRFIQQYLPCKIKYGWVDSTQSNIHTEALPATKNPAFLFYEKESFSTEGVLDFFKTVRAIQFILAEDAGDYRATKVIVPTSIADYTDFASAAIIRNWKTGELRMVIGAFYDGDDAGPKVDLSDEVTLGTITDQFTKDVFIHRDLDVDGEEWIFDFVGSLVRMRDVTLNNVHTRIKFALVGYWWSDHTVAERVALTANFGNDTVQFSTQASAEVAGNWRIGDMPSLYLYENNNLLFAARTK